MKYKLVYTRRAERDIKKLEPKVKERIGNALLRYGVEICGKTFRLYLR